MLSAELCLASWSILLKDSTAENAESAKVRGSERLFRVFHEQFIFLRETLRANRYSLTNKDPETIHISRLILRKMFCVGIVSNKAHHNTDPNDLQFREPNINAV